MNMLKELESTCAHHREKKLIDNGNYLLISVLEKG